MRAVKRILMIMLSIMICSSISACSNISKHEKKNNDNADSEIRYHNLVEEKDLDELEELLIANGVDKNAVSKIRNSVQDYNSTIGKELLKSEGTIELEVPIPQYDDVAIDERWWSKNDLFVGYNCRMTAFEIMKDFISVTDTTQSDPAALFMDLDAIDNSEDQYFTEEEIEKFEAVYSTIMTTSSTDPEEQYRVQQEYWNRIGVTFNNNESLSLISVYIHNHFSDEDNELIIGHTGVLVEAQEGYIFFEKLSFQLPYQMIYFNTKDELKQYLMAAYDTDTTGECAKPFILENDHLME